MGLKLQTYYAALRFDIVPGGFSPRCALLVADRLSTATSKQPSWSAEILLHAAMFLPTAMLHYLCSLASYSRTAATLPPTPLKVGWAHAELICRVLFRSSQVSSKINCVS